MRKWLIIAAVVFQGLALAYMGAEREYVVRTGRTVYLRTAPVDPRDLFRGDYVRLRYEASTIPRHLLAGDLANEDVKEYRRGRRVYAALKADDGGLAEVVSASYRRPDDKLFIRGWTDYGWRTGVLRVRYGLEAYFVQQGKGLELERQRRRDDGIRVPLEMEVALGNNGVSVIKGHRWAPLGIGIEIEREVANDRGRQERRVVAAKLKLLNASEKPLAIVDLPGGMAFSLEQDLAWGGNRDWRWVNEEGIRPKVNDSHVHVLQPGDIYSVDHIDLKDESWFVIGEDGEAKSLSELPRWGPRFRLVYRPPFSEQCRNLKQANLIWHGRLQSPAFSPSGRVD